MSAPIAVEHLTVEFPAVRALADVTLRFSPGEVHGIVGENGAGKSTLMRVLAGLQQPTSGHVTIDDRRVRLGSAADAMRRGVAMIHQELNLVDELSVAENLFLGRFDGFARSSERRGPARAWRSLFLRRKAMRDRALQLLASVGSSVDPDTRLGKLPVAQQQMVEIAKSVGQDARVLIMDEPTAVLGERESQKLFSVIRRLREEGRTIIYVSHRLPEVLVLCDRITVLRDGRQVVTLAGHERARADEARLASLMVGRPMERHFPPRHAHGESVRLEVEDFNVLGHVADASFDVRAGEIFGLAGLIGAGRTELGEGIVGLRRASGIVRVDGEPTRIRNAGDARRDGIAYLSEDRKAAGLTLEMSIAANTTMATLRQYCHPFIDRKAEREVTLAHAGNLRTRYGRISDPVSTLSGGNQQKVALAKWLDAKPKVLILDEPTRGVDIGAKEEIYRVIQKLADEGMACIVISSELNEILGLCHRIGVMRGGRMVAIYDGPSATEQQIMHAAAGVSAA